MSWTAGKPFSEQPDKRKASAAPLARAASPDLALLRRLLTLIPNAKRSIPTSRTGAPQFDLK
jgi:hypothetical protein